MPDFKETAEVIKFVDEWEGLSKDDQKRKSMSLLVTTTFAVKELENNQATMQRTIADMPCQGTGFVAVLASLSRSKKLAAWIAGIIIGGSVVLGSLVGLAQAVQAWAK